MNLPQVAKCFEVILEGYYYLAGLTRGRSKGCDMHLRVGNVYTCTYTDTRVCKFSEMRGNATEFHRDPLVYEYHFESHKLIRA